MGKFKTVNELVNSLKPDHPVYCIRLNEIKKSVKFFKDNFPGKILYAVKTNPNEKIIKQIIANGVNEFDVASLNEIKLIKKLYLAPGYIDHMTYVMVAKELSLSSLSGDEPEELEVIRVHRDDVINFLDKNEIIDSRVHAALNIIENHE